MTEGPRGPWAMARDLDEIIAKHVADLAEAPASERGQIRKRLKIARGIQKWCTTRAGYVDPAKN